VEWAADTLDTKVMVRTVDEVVEVERAVLTMLAAQAAVVEQDAALVTIRRVFCPMSVLAGTTNKKPRTLMSAKVLVILRWCLFRQISDPIGVCA